jgi:hypothetical protein
MDGQHPAPDKKLNNLKGRATLPQSAVQAAGTAVKHRLFLGLYEGTFPCVGFFNGKNKCVTELLGENSKEKYQKAFQKVIDVGK